MRVAYSFDDYPDCNLTDLNSLIKCSGGDDTLTHFCQLMFEPIEFIGFSSDQVVGNRSLAGILNTNFQAVADGLVDTAIDEAYITEERLKYISFSMPFEENHFAIAMNREIVQYDNTYDNDYFISAFQPPIWVMFLILSIVCIFLDAKLRKIGRFKYHLPCSLELFLSKNSKPRLW